MSTSSAQLNILKEAEHIIYGDREKTYGSPGKNLRKIADLWSAYLERDIRAEDVANLMILLKVARLINTPDHRDSLTDICGYAALIERVHVEEA